MPNKQQLLSVTLTTLLLLQAASPALAVDHDKGLKSATVLLITDKSLAKTWEDFAEWKTTLGKATKILTVQDIAESFQASSIQEKIRLCVRDHIDNHKTRWVILGGDAGPNGTGLVPGGHTTYHSRERAGIPTDIVYISPTNWDADGDGRHGEWPDDLKAITYPTGEIGLGRIPVRTAQDVRAFTEKVKAYESRYPENKFATNIIYTNTERPAYAKVRRSWDSYLSKAWKGHAERFFSDYTPWDKGNPGSHDLSSENLVQLINSKKIGKFHIHGHGILKQWVLERSHFTAKNVKQLKNDGAYPLMTTVSCFTGHYDSKNDPSIVESMIRAPKAGSVAIVAPVRTGKPHFAKRSDFRLMVREGKLDGTTLTMTRYWVHGLGSKELSTGRAFMTAKADMAEDARKSPAYHLCVCELNLLGDPTLDMRSKTPKTPSLEIKTELKVGPQTVVVHTTAPKATVCLKQGPKTYVVTQTDEKGVAKFAVSLAKGPLTLTVTGKSLNAVSTTCHVGAKPKREFF